MGYFLRYKKRNCLHALYREQVYHQVLFNDTVLMEEGLCTHADGRDHHLHIILQRPEPNVLDEPQALETCLDELTAALRPL